MPEKLSQSQGLEFRLAEGWENKQEPWRAFVLEVARDAQGKIYHRNARSRPSRILEIAHMNAGTQPPSVAYIRVDGPKKRHRFDCTDCSAEIQVATVYHPLEYPNGMSGEVKLEVVPYCPSCEGKPDVHGEPMPAALKEGWKIIGQPYATEEEMEMWRNVMGRMQSSRA